MMGSRLQEDDPRFATHKAYYTEYGGTSDLMLIENVTEYPVSLVKQHLGADWEVFSICVDPRNVGLGVSRARVYIVAFRKSKLAWTAPYTLSEFLDCVASKHIIAARDYFWQDLPKAELTPAADTCRQLNTGFRPRQWQSDPQKNCFQTHTLTDSFVDGFVNQ